MSPLGRKSFLLLSLAVAMCYLVGFLLFQSNRHSEYLRDELQRSYQLQKTAASLDSENFNKSIHEEMQKNRAQIDHPSRQLYLSNVIQAYGSGSPRLLKKRIDEFLKAETLFTDFTEGKLEFEKKKIFFIASFGLFLFTMIIFWIGSFLRSGIFSPLKELNKQMLDFLNGSYSYKFSVPLPNEVGELQSTFHAMAQKVLMNMEELQRLDQAKSEFLNIASHELRTPMTSIKGSLGLVTSGTMGTLDKDVQGLMEIAETETDRLIRLTNDILDMAKIEAGKMPLQMKWQPLEHVFQHTVNGLVGLSETSKVGIRAADIPPIEVEIDHDRIQQVLTNLLSNALKFSPAESFVELRASVNHEGHLEIEVKDQGRGISPEDQALIFQKFRQATNSENPLVKGTGLGLAIAKAIVEEHHGLIGVRSQIGVGSTFFFTLPRWRRSLLNRSSEIVTTLSTQKGDAA